MAFVSSSPVGASALCSAGLYWSRQRTCAATTTQQRHCHALPKCPTRPMPGSNAHVVVCSVEPDTAAAIPSASAIDFSTKGMTIDDFFDRSIGEWKSQRSSHNLIWTQFEQITSAIVIAKLDDSNDDVIQLCANNQVNTSEPFFSFKMEWEGESDWDDEVSQGSSVMSVVKDGPSHGRLLRSIGYAETIPAVGTWHMTDEGVFVLKTLYDAAAAEERIWFATPHLRMRVSQILTSSGSGVVTASFSTEIRRLNIDDQ